MSLIQGAPDAQCDFDGILTADAIYAVIGDYAANRNAKLLDFVAKNVIVTGEVAEKDGVKSINVKSIKAAN